MDRTQDQSQSLNDEISLVDLAVTFVRRRKIFYLVFVLCALAGVAYAVLASATYSYVSLVQVAMASAEKPMVSPESTIANLENQWLPRVRAEYESKQGGFPFKVSFENPESTQLIRITTESGEDLADTLKEVHKQLINELKAFQEGLLADRRKRLAGQINSVTKLVDSLESSGVSGEALATAINRRIGLETDLESLAPAKTLVVGRQSPGKVGPKRALIVVLAVVLGAMLGLFAAFFWEFMTSVRKQLKAHPEV